MQDPEDLRPDASTARQELTKWQGEAAISKKETLSQETSRTT